MSSNLIFVLNSLKEPKRAKRAALSIEGSCERSEQISSINHQFPTFFHPVSSRRERTGVGAHALRVREEILYINSPEVKSGIDNGSC